MDRLNVNLSFILLAPRSQWVGVGDERCTRWGRINIEEYSIKISSKWIVVTLTV